MLKRISELLPSDLSNGLGTTFLRVPAWAFLPDQWSVAFLRGLLTLADSWKNKCIWEVGVGTGINQLVLGKLAPQTRFYFSDLDPRCAPLVLSNLTAAGLMDKRFTALPGIWDLVWPPEAEINLPKVEVLFGCLPQVPTEMNLSVGDRLAHYYDPDHYHEAHLHHLGLGLNEALLRRAPKVLKANGQVVLNLSGRPGLRRLTKMFQACGYRPEIAHAATIAQHAGTSLASLAAMEAAGQPNFEFFADASATMRLNARQAEQRRIKGREVYHKIYVIAGTLMM